MGAIAIAARKKINPYNRNYTVIPVGELEIVYDCHEAIVTRDLWQKANTLHRQVGHSKKEHKYPQRELYKGKTTCAHCGKALQINVKNRHGYLSCPCWLIDGKISGMSFHTYVLTRFLLAEISTIARICESNEKHACSYIVSHLGSSRDRSRVEIEIEINKTLKRIVVIDDKVSNFDQYTVTNIMQPKQRAAILNALESSRKEEKENLKKLRESDRVMPSGCDIEQFIHLARRYGYIDSIERGALEELVEKIYITKKMTDSSFQQDRIVVKYKHIGVLAGIYKPSRWGR